jgi:hypothetical protein
MYLRVRYFSRRTTKEYVVGNVLFLAQTEDAYLLLVDQARHRLPGDNCQGPRPSSLDVALVINVSFLSL